MRPQTESAPYFPKTRLSRAFLAALSYLWSGIRCPAPVQGGARKSQRPGGLLRTIEPAVAPGPLGADLGAKVGDAVLILFFVYPVLRCRSSSREILETRKSKKDSAE